MGPRDRSPALAKERGASPGPANERSASPASTRASLRSRLSKMASRSGILDVPEMPDLESSNGTESGDTTAPFSFLGVSSLAAAEVEPTTEDVSTKQVQRVGVS